MKLYSLYERPRECKRWTRVSEYSYPLNTAIRVFQSRLLDYMLAGGINERRLRPVTKIELRQAK